MAFQHLQPELLQFSLSHIAAIESKGALVQAFSRLPEEKLSKICSLLSVRDTGVDGIPYKKDFILEIIAEKYEKKTSQIDSINNLALYPTEASSITIFFKIIFAIPTDKPSVPFQKILWDDAVVRSEFYSGEHCLALPKLNLQFLTMHDYLLRNFNLFRLESNYEIHSDLEEVIQRMSPEFTQDANTNFRGNKLPFFLIEKTNQTKSNKQTNQT